MHRYERSAVAYTAEQAAALDAAGFRIVPKVATAEMCQAGREVQDAQIDDVWAVMLSAAPDLAGIPQPHGSAAQGHDIIDD